MTNATKAERSIIANEVVKTLALLFAQRGESTFIRSDNGPEFIAKAVKGWLEVLRVRTLYIELGSPWENAYSKRFISRLGGLGAELSKREVFASLVEAKVLVKEYRTTTTTACHTALLATRLRWSLRRHASRSKQMKTIRRG